MAKNKTVTIKEITDVASNPWTADYEKARVYVDDCDCGLLNIVNIYKVTGSKDPNRPNGIYLSIGDAVDE